MITVEQKREIVKEFGGLFGKGEQDTGNAAVQVALLTTRINGLKEHFGQHIHDFDSNRGLLKMIGRRKAFLKYIQRKNDNQYRELIGKLGLRK